MISTLARPVAPALFTALTTALAGALTLAASASAQESELSNPKSAFVDVDKGRNWSGEVKRTERGHLIGKPDARMKLIEFVSYTCPHCASFTRQGEPAIDLTLLTPGEMSLEVRPVIRNNLDLTVSLLVACGDPAGFKARHRDFMWSQDIWLERVRNAPQTQQAIWLRGDAASRVNAAAALDLDDKLIARGATMSEIIACLSDDAAAKALDENSDADRAEFGVPGTPSFALNGQLLKDVHEWATLYPVLSAEFMANSGSASDRSGG